MDWEDRYFDKRLGSWDWGYEAPRVVSELERHHMGSCRPQTCEYCQREFSEEGCPL